MPFKTGTWGEQAKKRALKRNEYFRLYKAKRSAIKLKARYLVSQAIINGRLKKGPCEVCGLTEGKIEAHHYDHNDPLNIAWLCPKHHRRVENITKIYIQGTKKCLTCGTEIFPPKYKYCSIRCNLKRWKSLNKDRV